MAKKTRVSSKRRVKTGAKKTRTPAQKAATARMLAARANGPAFSPEFMNAVNAAARQSSGMVGVAAANSRGRKSKPKARKAVTTGTGFGYAPAAKKKRKVKRKSKTQRISYVEASSGVKKTVKKRVSRKSSASGGRMNEQRVITASDIIGGKTQLGNHVWTCLGPVRRGCGGGARLGRFTSFKK